MKNSINSLKSKQEKMNLDVRNCKNQIAKLIEFKNTLD